MSYPIILRKINIADYVDVLPCIDSDTKNLLRAWAHVRRIKDLKLLYTLKAAPTAVRAKTNEKIIGVTQKRTDLLHDIREIAFNHVPSLKVIEKDLRTELTGKHLLLRKRQMARQHVNIATSVVFARIVDMHIVNINVLSHEDVNSAAHCNDIADMIRIINDHIRDLTFGRTPT